MSVKILYKFVGATIGRPPENISWVPKKTYVCTPIVVGTGVLDGPNTIEFNDYKMACFFKSMDNTDIILINVVTRTVGRYAPYARSLRHRVVGSWIVLRSYYLAKISRLKTVNRF